MNLVNTYTVFQKRARVFLGAFSQFRKKRRMLALEWGSHDPWIPGKTVYNHWPQN